MLEHFDCGPEPHAQEVTKYIKASVHDEGALFDMGRGRAEVWVYANEALEIVGFGSLGTTAGWRWPDSKKKTTVHHIPALGIDHRFRGKPTGPREDRYSQQIVDALIEQARTRANDAVARAITLYVDPNNTAGIRLYCRSLFEFFDQVYPDKATGIRYQGMLRPL